MVERYRCYGWGIRRGEMRPELDGEWVRYSDYEALTKKLDEVREVIRPFAALLDSYTTDAPDDYAADSVVPHVRDLRAARRWMENK